MEETRTKRGLNKDYTWDLYVHSSNIIIHKNTPNKLVRAVVKQSTDGARGAQGFRSGCHTFQFSMNDMPWGSHCSIGICGEKTRMRRKGYTDLFGIDGQSWAWDIPSRELLHKGDVMGVFAKGEDIPKVIRMTVNLDEGYISYDAGFGEHTCFKGVKSKGGLLFPAVSVVYGNTEVVIELLESFLPDDPTIAPDISKPVYTQNGENSSDTAADERNNRDGVPDSVGKETEPMDTGGLAPANDNTSQSMVTDSTAVSMSSIASDKDATKDALGVTDMEQRRTSIVRQDTYTYVIKDIPDDEKRTDLAADALVEGERFLLQVAHAWDNTAKAGRLELLPNAPCVCIPSLNYKGKVQGVRGRRLLRRGNHRWRVRQLDLVGCGGKDTEWNELLIGIADEEHRMFNYGFSLGQVGRHAWCWDPTTGQIWHDDKCVDTKVENTTVDWRDGIECVLDIPNNSLMFILGVRNLRLQLDGIRSSAFYPFVIAKTEKRRGLQIEYLMGDEEHVMDTLGYMSRLSKRDFEDFVGYRGMLKHGNSSGTILDNDKKMLINWAMSSENVTHSQHCKNRVVIEMAHDVDINHGLVFAEHPLSAGKHSVDVTIEQADFLALALVKAGVPLGDMCVAQSSSRDQAVLLQQAGTWAWDVTNKSLYYSGHYVGPYPVYYIDLSKVSGYRINVVFGHDQTASIAFSALTDTDGVIDLGVAFIFLPGPLIPAVCAGTKFNTAKIAIHYHAGPEGFVRSISPSSKACSIQ